MVMDTMEAARFTAREGFADIKDEVAWTPKSDSAMVFPLDDDVPEEV